MEELNETLRVLESSAAIEALERDPYWPKWDGPYWRMVLLWEMGLASRIPHRCVETLIASLDRNLLHYFPKELPPGVDPFRGIPCHCQLGTVYQLLHACGVDVDRALPWIRPWFLKYQLPDGGLNCDEQSSVGSIVSTLPPLEAVLSCTPRPLTAEERSFLDRGARYLLERKLYRSKRTGQVIDESWLRPAFPRFYFYDVARGHDFLSRMGHRIDEVFPPAVKRDLSGTMSRVFENGSWTRGPARTFPLLDRVQPSMSSSGR